MRRGGAGVVGMFTLVRFQTVSVDESEEGNVGRRAIFEASMSYLGLGRVHLVWCGHEAEVGDLAIMMVVLHSTIKSELERYPRKDVYHSTMACLQVMVNCLQVLLVLHVGKVLTWTLN